MRRDMIGFAKNAGVRFTRFAHISHTTPRFAKTVSGRVISGKIRRDLSGFGGICLGGVDLARIADTLTSPLMRLDSGILEIYDHIWLDLRIRFGQMSHVKRVKAIAVRTFLPHLVVMGCVVDVVREY